MRWSIAVPEPRARPVPDPDDLVACARMVEAGGWDGVWVSDHPFPLVVEGDHGHYAWDPFSALAFVAAATSRVMLQTNIAVLPYRNPFLLASAAATVQHLSGGRLALGVGTGYLRPEFDALGGGDFAARETRMREGVEAMEAAWSGAPVTARADGWSAVGNTLRPAARPRWLMRGGNSRAAIRHAAEAFDVWAPFEAVGDSAVQTRTAEITASAPAGLAARVALLREHAASVGRPAPEVWITRKADDWLEADRAAVLEQVAGLADAGVSLIAVTMGTVDQATPVDYARRLERLAALVR